MKNLIFCLFFAACGFLTVEMTAQSVYSLSSVGEIKVSGTSSLHDWEMTSESASGQARIKKGGSSISEINSLEFSLEVESLKSGRGRMDRNAYSTLESGSHPNIRFVLRNVKEITSNRVIATGNLTIAGQTRSVELSVNYRVRGNQIRFTGDHELAFSDFDIDPPTAMFGTVTTGDDLKIQIDVTYSLSN
jgi:hypothetical protein